MSPAVAIATMCAPVEVTWLCLSSRERLSPSLGKTLFPPPTISGRMMNRNSSTRSALPIVAPGRCFQ